MDVWSSRRVDQVAVSHANILTERRSSYFIAIQTVRTAQAISISQHEPLSADHIKRVLAIHKKFAEDFESSAPDYQVNSESWQSRSSLYR